MNQIKQITMTLASITLIIKKIQDIAYQGLESEENNDGLESILATILNTDPDTTESLYENIDLSNGYREIISQFSSEKNLDVTKYLMSILGLENKMTPSVLQNLVKPIHDIKNMMINDDTLTCASFEIIHEFANIYKDYISPLGAKIQISGNPQCLNDPKVQDIIRALLLAALRSAVLWSQVGGQRRQFIFSKAAILQAAKRGA